MRALPNGFKPWEGGRMAQQTLTPQGALMRMRLTVVDWLNMTPSQRSGAIVRAFPMPNGGAVTVGQQAFWRALANGIDTYSVVAMRGTSPGRAAGDPVVSATPGQPGYVAPLSDADAQALINQEVTNPDTTTTSAQAGAQGGVALTDTGAQVGGMVGAVTNADGTVTYVTPTFAPTTTAAAGTTPANTAAQTAASGTALQNNLTAGGAATVGLINSIANAAKSTPAGSVVGTTTGSTAAVTMPALSTPVKWGIGIAVVAVGIGGIAFLATRRKRR